LAHCSGLYFFQHGAHIELAAAGKRLEGSQWFAAQSFRLSYLLAPFGKGFLKTFSGKFNTLT